MAIYKPTELRELLLAHGLSPRKILSQNFLIDGNIIKKIAATAEIEPGDIVLEIGPGPGALTEELLSKGATVIAVEKDESFAELLKRLDNGHLHIFTEDIMDFAFEERLRPFLKDGKKAKVVANLPYHLTTGIVSRLVPMHDIFSNIVVMVQHEVALRYASKPDCSDYGSITLYLNFFQPLHTSFRSQKPVSIQFLPSILLSLLLN